MDGPLESSLGAHNIYGLILSLASPFSPTTIRLLSTWPPHFNPLLCASPESQHLPAEETLGGVNSRDRRRLLRDSVPDLQPPFPAPEFTEEHCQAIMCLLKRMDLD
ncbi:unnamed protein product [Cuscuta campestris]|uniref:Uncharacterized protein n=1 Tax=Cuscuta campestris TaxID=132261 RepID=A0A484NEY3_9ASTE|nr:unnamed protein product [Cuscuta campestris]